MNILVNQQCFLEFSKKCLLIKNISINFPVIKYSSKKYDPFYCFNMTRIYKFKNQPALYQQTYHVVLKNIIKIFYYNPISQKYAGLKSISQFNIKSNFIVYGSSEISYQIIKILKSIYYLILISSINQKISSEE